MTCCKDGPHGGDGCPVRCLRATWPARADLRASLIAAGTDPVYADLLAVVSQFDRPDLRAEVDALLGVD